MVFARHSGVRAPTQREQAEAEHKKDISVFPLAIPLIAGPGAITTVLLTAGGRHESFAAVGAMLAMLVVVLGLTLLSLLFSARIMKLLGETGTNVVGRVLGILLTALAVQFVLTACRRALPRATRRCCTERNLVLRLSGGAARRVESPHHIYGEKTWTSHTVLPSFPCAAATTS